MNFPAVILFCLVASAAFAQKESAVAVRTDRIVQALNSRPAQWLEPITAADVHLQGGAGRVDVNKKAKFSYFIQVMDAADPRSEILLVPMATSRYTPTYYQTDEWWDANKEALERAKREGRPAPRQDMNEVAKWLTEMKLSTNPPVFRIDGDGRVEVKSLQNFLSRHLLDEYADDGKIIFYRGGEKPTETDEWLAGRKPRGVRYWTPTATYAWRYARKNPTFLADLVDGKAPLYVFEMPVAAFREMTLRRWPHLTLGTELTKMAHESFNYSGRFMDHLFGGADHLAEGRLGVEIELRSNSKGAERMLEHFRRPISIEELANDRLKLFARAEARLVKTRPDHAEEVRAQFAARAEQVKREAAVLVALREKESRSEVQRLLELTKDQSPQLTPVDHETLQGLVRERLPTLPLVKAPICRSLFN